MKIVYDDKEKICTVCKKQKILSMFYKFADGKYGVVSRCKECCKKKMLNNYNKKKSNNPNYYKKLNKIKYKEILEINPNHNKEHYKKIKDNNPNYYSDYYNKNKTTINKNRRQYAKNKYNNDPLYKLKHNIRSRICCSFRNKFTKKSKKTTQILGCTFNEFKKHLENQFDENMNWNNHGSYWHLDHIKPISLAQNEKELIELNHYTNFQPLYWEDNLAKGNKY